MAEIDSFGRLSILLPKGVVRTYSKGRTILFQGEVPRSVLVIKQGLVKVYGITSTGDQRTVTILSPGDVFPMSWVFGKSGVCMYYYESLVDCEIVAVSKSTYEEALNEDPELLKQMSDTYMARYIASTMHVYALEQSHAQDKLAYILQYLVVRFGEQLSDGIFRIGLRLSHQDIAEMAGITRETAAVELSKLKKKGLIDYKKFVYTIDRSKLVRHTGSDEFNALTTSI